MKTKPLPNTFQAACALIQGAHAPETIFGELRLAEGKKLEAILVHIRNVFRALVVLVHPDKNPKDKIRAADAFRKLEDLRKRAEGLCQPTARKEATPEEFKPVTFVVGKNTYVITGRKAEGGMCGVFEGVLQGNGGIMPVIFKIPHTVDDNDLMEREAKAYLAMKKKAKELAVDVKGKKIAEKFLMRIPTFLETIQLVEPGKAKKKTVNVFARTLGLNTGWFTLEQIRDQYPQGVDTRVMCFIMNRIFEGLTLAHLTGIVHCGITPNHVLIQAKEHVGNIIDWTTACRIGEQDAVPFVDNERYGAYLPEELIDPKGIPTPATDIYMAAWCAVFLLGGDPAKRFIPNTVEDPIRDFLNKCLQPKRRFRPQGAAAAYKEFQQINTDLFGPRKFVGLTMPET